MSRSSEMRDLRLKQQQARNAAAPPNIQTLYQMGHQPSPAAMAFMYGSLPGMYPGYQMAMPALSTMPAMTAMPAVPTMPVAAQTMPAMVAPVMQYVPIPLTGDEEDTDADPANRSNVLPMHGNTSNFNINSLLYNNILENEYFKALYQLRTYHEVLDEMQRSIQHVEPWQMGTARFPSTAFCLMAKFMSMKLTVKQMKGLLEKQDNPLLRAVGFLYLRYTAPPADLWKWFEPFLEEETEIRPCADQNVAMTIGEYCTKLLTDMQYYGTTLPRIPVPIERKIKVMLLLLNEKRKRRKSNLRAESEGLFAVGTKVRAIYSDAENEPAWYEAVIESYGDEDHKYWVKYTEYGNTECVDLGDMELLQGEKGISSIGSGGKEESSSDIKEEREEDRERRGRSRSDSHPRGGDRGGGGRDRERSRERDSRGHHGDHRSGRRDSRSRSRDRDDRNHHRSSGSGSYRGRSPDDRRGGGGSSSSSNLLEQVLQSERNASAAVGKNYGARPATYKGSLSLKADRYTARQKSPPRSDRGGGRDGEWHRDGPYRVDRNSSNSSNPPPNSSNSSSSGRQEMSQDQIDRMKMLKDRYGDVSTK